MELVINNRVIDTPIPIILNTIREELGINIFSSIKDKGENIQVTCPFHKNGNERKPSGSIYCGDSKDVEYGTFNCFTCHTVCSLPELVGRCYGETTSFGEEWLSERFGSVIISPDPVYSLKEISLDNDVSKHSKKPPLSELDWIEEYHPYMQKRKITEEIANRFHLGHTENSIVFPLYSVSGECVGYSERNIYNKYFNIQIGVNDKPVYLLNELIKSNAEYAIVTEAQIDALTAWGYGIPACAFMGTGAKCQYEDINKSPITTWITMFDNDEAGRKATALFKKMVRNDVFVLEAKIPVGYKDINDLSKELFDECIKKSFEL